MILLLHAVSELHAADHFCKPVKALQSSEGALGADRQFVKSIESSDVLEKAPFTRSVRCRIVAKVDSITFDVRRRGKLVL